MRLNRSSLPVIVLVLFCACNYTKHLTENQTLVRRNSIELQTLKPIKYKGEFESSILSLVSPASNSHVFDLDFLPKYKLWKYNNRYAYYESHDSDKKLIKHKVEAPALYKDTLMYHSAKLIKQYLNNQGFFYAEVQPEVVSVGKKMVDVHYKIKTGKSYFINKSTVSSDQASILSLLNEKGETYFRKGDVFNNITCALERDRIYKLMQQQGYFDFRNENIIFKIDTLDKQKMLGLLDDPFEQSLVFHPDSNQQRDSLNVRTIISKTKDSLYSVQYHIDSVIVYLNDNVLVPQAKTRNFNQFDSIWFVYTDLPVNRKVIARNIFIQPGELFNPYSKELTVNRLNQLNIFQFVNIKYDKVPGKVGSLVCRIALDMQKKREYTLNLDANTTDASYYFGFGIEALYRDKNLFHGANQFTLKGSISDQFRNDTLLDGVKHLYSSGNNVNLNASLVFPKFIVPFNSNILSKRNLPFTIVGLNYNNILRRGNYTIRNLSGNFGYTWRETSQKNWRLNPAFLTLTFVPAKDLSEAFKQKITSPYLQSVFSPSIIYGENVNFEYKSKERGLYKNQQTVKIGFEEAGTILKGINELYKAVTATPIEPISHYVRLDGDYRTYHNRRKAQWVNRVLIGLGAPLSNANSLPYIKQYAAGGSFSLRGFQSRTVGPGRSSDTSYTGKNVFVDRTGDMKFEFNSEYRFNLLKLFSGAINLKGAAFADIGNIWLFKQDASIPGGEFQPKYFLRDLALCAGTGLRLDFSFFVLRLDMAYPLKKPNVSSHYGFVVDKLNYIKDANVVLGFGYPF